MNKGIKITISAILIAALTGCNISDRVSRIGKAPDLKEVNTYENDLVPDEIAMLKDDDLYEAPRTANSLWRAGSRTFFRDQRARSVGDILKVVVTIQDKAKLDNKTETTRNDSGTAGIPSVMGYEKKIAKFLPGNGTVDPSALIDVNSTDTNSGVGKIDRKETINTTIAATVTKILPSNNLVINGTQEIRVNNEVREVTVEGIVRPEDISAQNSVTLDQIAEARVSYGGRGNISDYQQPRYGKQLLDIVAPF